MKTPRLLGLVPLLLAFAASSAFAAAGDSAVTIKNKSDWDIHELYLSAVDDNEWGLDQLGEDVIGSGEDFLLYGIECDIFDVRLVDEDGDVCVVGGVKLCNTKTSWTISNRDLLSCQNATDE